MIVVSEIQEAIKAVLGTCTDETFYAKINEAQEELANLANWDPLTVSLDICTTGCEITLPDDIEVPLAINVGGVPSDFRNKWFEFHMNGPGSECCAGACSFSWMDKGNFPTFRDPSEPSTVSATSEEVETLGAAIRVYGYDDNDKWIMSADENGVLQDGYDVEIASSGNSVLPSTQIVKRFTRISKPVTNGFVNIVSNDTDSTLLGLIRPNITEPQFRRIKVSGHGTNRLCPSPNNPCTTGDCSTWVRMRARKKTFKVTQLSDVIPLHSVTALKMMVMAIRKYEADLLDEYAKYFTAAREALMREQKSRSGPNQIKIQFQGSYAGRPGENMI